MHNSRSRLTILSIITATILAMSASASAGPKKTEDVAKGHLSEFAAAPADADISGPVRLTRTATTTTVRMNVNGLDGHTTYTAHLHANACDEAFGGPHYQDVTGGPAEPPNELWLSITTNGAGNGHDASTSGWAVGDGARSVVIHHPVSSARIACADLAVG